MDIRIDDPSRAEIVALLKLHMADMVATSPPESVHALDVDGLCQFDVTFWSVWINDQLAGVGALKQLDAHHGEIKSMRTVRSFARQGVAKRLLNHVLQQALAMGLTRVSLETGSMDFFAAARALYERAGFQYCHPFADYAEDPNSVFMTKELK